MTERPILFSGQMVRALLAGTKTQTRRVMKSPPPEDVVRIEVAPYHPIKLDRHGEEHPGEEVFGAYDCTGSWGAICPYGKPGDRLWVRETFMDLRGTGVEHRPDPRGPLQRYAYQADTPPGSYGDEARKDYGLKWKPSIHMPRAACRLVLEITEVRIERLQEISAEDARAEGITFTDYGRQCGHTGRGWTEVGGCDAPADTHPQRPGWGVEPTSHMQCMHSAPTAFAALWSQINGVDSWAANPWVWAVSFKPINGSTP